MNRFLRSLRPFFRFVGLNTVPKMSARSCTNGLVEARVQGRRRYPTETSQQTRHIYILSKYVLPYDNSNSMCSELEHLSIVQQTLGLLLLEGSDVADIQIPKQADKDHGQKGKRALQKKKNFCFLFKEKPLIFYAHTVHKNTGPHSASDGSTSGPHDAMGELSVGSLRGALSKETIYGETIAPM